MDTFERLRLSKRWPGSLAELVAVLQEYYRKHGYELPRRKIFPASPRYFSPYAATSGLVVTSYSGAPMPDERWHRPNKSKNPKGMRFGFYKSKLMEGEPIC